MTVAKILIVDDETAILRAWERALRNAGYSVTTAQVAKAALDLCNEHTYDIVILDYIMPSMNGLELLTRIRKIQPMVRSILVSGKLDTKLDEQTLRAELKQSVEVDIYLHKPVSNQRLVEAVRSLLTNGSTSSWKDVASRTLEGKRGTIKNAKAATKQLDKLKKKR